MLAPDTITLQDVTLGYDRHPAVHHLDGRIAPGARLAVVGPNGAGKSTLLKGLIGELKPLAGRIASRDLARKQLAYVPQKDGIDLSYPVSVFDLVAMGLWRRKGLFGGFDARDEAQISAALARVGLGGFERRAVGTLSGGQLQRALFARVTLQDAPVILLDEPFSAIDTGTVDDLMAVIEGWTREGRTVVAVLHDLAIVRKHFPQTLLLSRRMVGWGPTAEVLTDRRLAEARGLVEAFDEAAPTCDVAHGPHAHEHHHDHAHGEGRAEVHGQGRGHGHDHGPHHAHAHPLRAVEETGSPDGRLPEPAATQRRDVA
jgi:zinc/manganese transport system ATP-binding protein